MIHTVFFWQRLQQFRFNCRKDDICFRRWGNFKIGKMSPKPKLEAATQTDFSVGPNVFMEFDLNITEHSSRLLLSARHDDQHTESSGVGESRNARNPFSRTYQRDSYQDNRAHSNDSRLRKHSNNTENNKFYRHNSRDHDGELRSRIDSKRKYSSERSCDDGRKVKRHRSTSHDRDEQLPVARTIGKRRMTLGQPTDQTSNERRDDFDYRKTRNDQRDKSKRDVTIRCTSNGNVQIDVTNDLQKLYEHSSNRQIRGIIHEKLQVLRHEYDATKSVEKKPERSKRCDNEKPSVTITKVSKSTEEERLINNDKNNDRQRQNENKSADSITLTKIDRLTKSTVSPTELSAEDNIHSTCKSTNEVPAITILTNSKENSSTQKPLNILLMEMEMQESQNDNTELDNSMSRDDDKSKPAPTESIQSGVVPNINEVILSNSKVSSSISQPTSKRKSKSADDVIVCEPKINDTIEIPSTNHAPSTVVTEPTANGCEDKSNSKSTKKSNKKVIQKQQKNPSHCSLKIDNKTDDKRTKRQEPNPGNGEIMVVSSSTVSIVDNVGNCKMVVPVNNASGESVTVASPIYDEIAVKLAVASITEINVVEQNVSPTTIDPSQQKPIEIVSDIQEVSVIPIDKLESSAERVATKIAHESVVQPVSKPARTKPRPNVSKPVKKPPKKVSESSSHKKKRKSGDVTPVKNSKTKELFKVIFGDSSPITKYDCPPVSFTDALLLKNNNSVANSSFVEDAHAISGTNQLLEGSVPVDSATSFYQDFDISNVSSHIDPMSPMKVPSKKAETAADRKYVDQDMPKMTTPNDTPTDDSTSAMQALLQNSTFKASPYQSTSADAKQKRDRPIEYRIDSHCEDIDQIQEYLRDTVSDAKTPMKKSHQPSTDRNDPTHIQPSQSQIDCKSDGTNAIANSSNVIHSKPVISFENIFNREQIMTTLDDKLSTKPRRRPPFVELSTSCMDIDVELTESLVHNSKTESEAINTLLNPLITPRKSGNTLVAHVPTTVDAGSLLTTVNNVVESSVTTKLDLDNSTKSTGSNRSPVKEQKCGHSTYYVEEGNEEVIIHLTRKRRRRN